MIDKAISKTQKEILIPLSLILLMIVTSFICNRCNYLLFLFRAFSHFILKTSHFKVSFLILNLWKLAVINLLRFQIRVIFCISYLLGCLCSFGVIDYWLSELLCKENVYNHIPSYKFRHTIHSIFNFFERECNITATFIVLIFCLQRQQILDFLETFRKVLVFHMFLFVLAKRF